MLKLLLAAAVACPRAVVKVLLAELLIDAGVDIDAGVMGSDGETALMYHEGMVNLLIEHGVDVKATDNAGNTAVDRRGSRRRRSRRSPQ